jgi:hypothetical protein
LSAQQDAEVAGEPRDPMAGNEMHVGCLAERRPVRTQALDEPD